MRKTPAAFVVLALGGIALVGLPLVGLLTRARWSRAWDAVSDPMALDALRLSAVVSIGATAITVVRGSRISRAWFRAPALKPGQFSRWTNRNPTSSQ